MIEMFQEWYDNRHEYAKNWKERTEEYVQSGAEDLRWEEGRRGR
jgi:hypothetical protein